MPAIDIENRETASITHNSKLSFPRVRTPISRRVENVEFSSLFRDEPEYKFDSFIVECFICQNSAVDIVKPSYEDIEDIEITDSHELNGSVTVSDDDNTVLVDVVVSEDDEEDVEDSTEVVY